MLEIRENYRAWQPPPWVRPTVDRLLASLQPEHIGGLRSIVLTDSAAIGRGKTRRVAKRKFNRRECRGFYHAARHGQQPWIQLVVDNIISSYPDLLLGLQFGRDVVIGQTLFHEIGHHLHETVGSATSGGERAAEDWRRRLTRLHGRKRYWYLRPLRPALQAFARILRGARKLRNRLVSPRSLL